jgi:cobalt-zinc-cadmium efflux system outer membrane protein
LSHIYKPDATPWRSLSLAVPSLLKITALAFLATLPATPAVGQESPPPVPAITPEISTEPAIALEELIRRAVENNPQLSVARENLEAARQRLGAARARGNPVLQIVPGLGSREARDEEIVLSQPLDLFGRRRARAGVAAAHVRRADAENTLAERTLVVAVKNAAAELFAAQEAETLGNVQLEVARLFRDAAARRAQLGDVPPVQVQRAELELLRVENELTNARAERLSRGVALNQLIGQAPETPLRVALPVPAGLGDILRARPAPLAQIPQTDALPANDSDLTTLRTKLLPALSARPDIVGAEANVDARRAQIQMLRRERRPDVEIQARRSSATGSGSTALRAVIVVPLFDFGSSSGERRALEAEARAGEAQVTLLRQQAAAQVEVALIRLQQQRRTVERYRSGIVPQTLELLRKTQIGYAQGASTYLEVLEAQRTLRQVQSEYLQALIGTRTSEAQLEGALGTTLPAWFAAPFSSPAGATPPPGIAVPGTVPAGTVSPNTVEPLNPAGAQGGSSDQ